MKSAAPAPHPNPLPDSRRGPVSFPSLCTRGEPGSDGQVPGLCGQGEGEGQQQTRANNWIRICHVDDIPRLGARVVRRGMPPNIAIFRTATDRFFALADRCPHRGGPLSQGIVFGERVACPLHNTTVDLESGCAVAPDKGEVQSFEIRIDGGFVYLDLATDT